jgi:hypothetical protein
MQPKLQKLSCRRRAELRGREGIRRKAGSREGSAGKRERIFAFGGPKSKILFLEASRRIEHSTELLPRAWREAREPQDLASRLPAFLRIRARAVT